MIAKIGQLILTFCLLLFLGLIPQINSADYIQSTVTSKSMFFLNGCLVMGAVTLIFVFFYKFKTIHISKFDVLLLMLLVYISTNKFIYQPYSSFSLRYIELLGLAFVYLVIRIIDTKNLIWILLIVIISGIIQAIHGNLQLLGYYPSNHSGFKMTGSFFNPGPYAGFLAAVWPLAFGLYLFKHKKNIIISFLSSHKSKILDLLLKYCLEYLPLIAIVSILLVLPASRSRAAWLSVILSSVVLLEYRYSFLSQISKSLSNLKKIGIGVTFAIMIGAGIYGIYHLNKGSSEGRLFIWNVSGEIIKDNLLAGVGFDRFKAHYMDYQADYFKGHNESANSLVADNSYYAFNEFLQFMVEEGLLGTILLFALMVLVFRIKTTDHHRHILSIIIAGVIAMAVFAFFSYTMQILPIKLVLVVLLVSLVKLDINKWDYTLKTLNNRVLLFGRMVGIFSLFFWLFNFFMYIRTIDCALKNWQAALETYSYFDYGKALESYKKAYPVLKKDGDFLMNYGKTLTMANEYDEAVVVLEEAKHYLNNTIIETALGNAYMALKNYNKAEKAYQNAADMIPVRFYPFYLLAKLYGESGQDEKAIAMANLILDKEIKIPSTAIKEIRAEMKKLITSKTQNNPTN